MSGGSRTVGNFENIQIIANQLGQSEIDLAGEVQHTDEVDYVVQEVDEQPHCDNEAGVAGHGQQVGKVHQCRHPRWGVKGNVPVLQ